MVMKNPVHPSRILTMSQGFQKGIICGGNMTKNSYSDGHLIAGENFSDKEGEKESCFFIALIKLKRDH